MLLAGMFAHTNYNAEQGCSGWCNEMSPPWPIFPAYSFSLYGAPPRFPPILACWVSCSPCVLLPVISGQQWEHTFTFRQLVNSKFQECIAQRDFELFPDELVDEVCLSKSLPFVRYCNV